MYSEEMLQSLQGQIKKRMMILTLPAVLLLLTSLYALFARLEWLAVLTTLVSLFSVIFFYDLCIKPIRCYARFLNEALHGRVHETSGTFSRFEPDISLVDGVRFRAMTILQPDEHGEMFDRLMYYDAQLPLPPLQEGDQLSITFHDRSIVGWKLVTD